MDGDDAVEAVLDDRVPRACPGELDVALVAEDGHAVGSPPRGRGPKVVNGARGVGRCVHPKAQGAGRVLVADGRQVEAPAVVDGDRHCSATGKLGAHRVGRIGDGRVENGVSLRVA